MTAPYQTAGVPDPFPSVPPPQNMDFSGFYPYGFGDLFVNPHLKTPYIYQYNLSVQRQLANGLMMELGYVGSSSHKLLTWLDENPIVPGQIDCTGKSRAAGQYQARSDWTSERLRSPHYV